MRLSELISKYREAREIISAWARDGAETVRPKVASDRAKICLACPLNVKKDFISRLAAKYVRFRIWRINGIILTIPESSKLGRCSACYCETSLKIFLPLKNIKPPESDHKKFDDSCWLFK